MTDTEQRVAAALAEARFFDEGACAQDAIDLIAALAAQGLRLTPSPEAEVSPEEAPGMTEPRTEAGKRLLDWLYLNGGAFRTDHIEAAILAIEAEAAMQSSRRRWLAVSRAALRDVPAEAEEDR